MLLQLENTNHEDVNKLLAYAHQNKLDLSIVDEVSSAYSLPGKPLTTEQLTQLIESSRKSGMISLTDAHQILRNNYNAD
jgi:hypothetical protein